MNTFGEIPQTTTAAPGIRGLQQDLFCHVEDYAWEWPETSGLSNALKFAHVYLRRSHWSGPLTSSQWAMLEGLTEKIGLQISFALSNPCPVYYESDRTRIEFLNCLAWVCDKKYRTIYLEVRKPLGTWEKSMQKVNLLQPLDDSRWLDLLMQHWMPQLTGFFGPRAGEATWNIQSALAHILGQFSNCLLATNRQIKHHLGLSSALVSIIRRISSWSSELAVDNETYAFLWKEEEAWLNLGMHYPELAHFYYLLRKEYVVQENANISGMRTRCLELGLNKAGWRFLCRHGPEAYVSFYSDFDDALAPPRALMAYLNWQADAGLKQPLDQLMATRVHESGCLTYTKDGSCHILLDPRLACVGEEVSGLAAKEGREEWYWGHLRHWRRVLEWIVDEQPHFDRNQYKAGWSAIFKRYQDWVRSCPSVTWYPILGSFRFGEWWIKELTNSSELELESLRMHHCAVTYVDSCSAGEYLMFSVEDAEHHKPMATIGFKKKKNGWSLDQVKGKFNSDPDPEFVQLAAAIKSRLSQQID